MVNCLGFSSAYSKNKVVKQSRAYDLELKIDNVNFNSAKFSWVYPEDIEFTFGDYISLILINEENGSQGETPIFSVIHGKDEADLSEITSFEINSLIHSTKYQLKLELSKIQGDYYSVEESFETSDFEIFDIQIEGAEEGVVRNKLLKVNWKTNPETVDFGENDKVEIFLKKLSDNDFSKKPIFHQIKMLRVQNFLSLCLKKCMISK